ncbi:uncharacterized protein N7498_007817 [Penicillium cinerascens]|uniref:Uncharacterized protein n=1 Tax=Penicillium cinerascens TaxID=70096 RepID=A0A9W9MDQ4_9EURO|nr:uncharacterized protein N7498_007817 [Penicillium cinerascens]KAJ5198700.1 hypothetical protein N7498_007817 [Penicillium cinerascens]
MASDDHSDAPPPYSSSFEDTASEKSDTEFLLPHQAAEPGFAVSSTLSRGLQVPSSTAACSSGFDYPDELTRYGITLEHWRQFTQAIQDEAKLSPQQWTTVIGKGLGALAIGGLVIGFFGAIPAFLIARTARKHQEQRNVIASMAGERGGNLIRHISHWNETFFRPRGVLIRVDLPKEYLDDMRKMDLHRNGSSKDSDERAREKAALKARIVIIPLEGSPVNI